jgi:UTP:GlnB (protein PII) uridylyltransferase
MDTSRCIIDPSRVDFLSLALDDSDTGASTAISLSEFSLGDPADHNGALQLEVRAADQLGFLAALLNRLAFLFLFPEEMHIDTVNGMAVDRFRLKGIGGTPPSATSRAALQRKLRVLVAI